MSSFIVIIRRQSPWLIRALHVTKLWCHHYAAYSGGQLFLTSVCKQCIFRDHRITWQIEYLAYMNTVPDIYMWLTIPRLFTYNLQVLLESSLDAEVKQFKHRTFADSTKRTYASQRDSYLAFCNVMGYCAIPASPATLCRYAAMLARTLQISSVKHYLNVIRLLHLEWHVPNAIEANFQLRCVLQGIRRSLGDQVSRKSPITPDMLLRILRHFDLVNPVTFGLPT